MQREAEAVRNLGKDDPDSPFNPKKTRARTAQTREGAQVELPFQQSGEFGGFTGVPEQPSAPARPQGGFGMKSTFGQMQSGIGMGGRAFLRA